MSEGSRRTGTTSGADPEETVIRPANEADQTVIRDKDDFYKRPSGESKPSDNGQSGGEQLTLAQRVMRGQPMGTSDTATPTQAKKPNGADQSSGAKQAPSTSAAPSGAGQAPAGTASTDKPSARTDKSSAGPTRTDTADDQPTVAAPTGAAAAGAAGAGAAATSGRTSETVTGAEATDKPEAGTKSEASTKTAAAGSRRTRKARLRLARIDPWSVMKTAFLFSIAGGIVLLVAVYVIWGVIGSSGLFEAVDQMVQDVIATPGDTTPFRVDDYVNTDRVMGVTALLAFVDVVIFTALATLGSFLYNLAATMLGGLEVTLAED